MKKHNILYLMVISARFYFIFLFYYIGSNNKSRFVALNWPDLS